MKIFLGDKEQLPRCILMDFLDILKSGSSQVGSDFGKEENSQRAISG